MEEVCISIGSCRFVYVNGMTPFIRALFIHETVLNGNDLLIDFGHLHEDVIT
jgi:hypothetical protein